MYKKLVFNFLMLLLVERLFISDASCPKYCFKKTAH